MNEELIGLAGKYLSDTMEPMELERLLALVQEASPEDLDRAFGSVYEQAPLENSSAGDAREAVFQALTRHIQGAGITSAVKEGREVDDNKDSARKTPVLGLFRYGAAAAIAGLLIWGGLKWWQSDHQEASLGGGQLVGARPHLMPPGNARAVLTLADGSQVVLDSLLKDAQPGKRDSAWNEILASKGPQSLLLDSNLLDYHRKASVKGSDGAGFNTLNTSRGIQYQVVLPDGTRVWLNAASSLRYPLAFTGPERVVELNGEAYFDVAPDHRRPFRVQAGQMKIEVLGTGFDVMSYSDEPAVKATLFEGAVRVSNNKDGKMLQLKPGEQASLKADGDGMVLLHPNLDEVAGWREGKLVFKKRKIEEIMRQISRWYDVEVLYQGRKPAAALSGELPKKADASQLLEILESTDNVHFEVRGRQIIVRQ